MTKKITHLTSAHTRFDIRVFYKECLSLAKIDTYRVTLVVADGNENIVENNVNIIDVGKSKGRYNRFFKTTKLILEKAIELNSDIYHFHDPELIPIGLKLKKLGYTVVFDIHENTDLQILEREWIPFFLRKGISMIFRAYEMNACAKFDYIIVPQHAMHDKFSEINRVAVIANFPSIKKTGAMQEKRYSKYNLLYSGSITEARGLFNMLNLLVKLINIDSKYTITIAGDMSSDLLVKAKKHKGWGNVNYLGYLSQNDLKKIYMQCSIGLIMFNNVGQYHMAYALKLFEYMQDGLTVIMPDFGDWLYFNNEYKVGYNIDVFNSKSIAQTIDSITEDQFKEYAIKNKSLVNERFSWESQEEKLYQLYEKLINANKI